MEFDEVIRNRYACKKFDGKAVEREKLDAILEAGRLAPTAKNLQEQRIYVVQSESGLAKIDKLTPCRYGAKTVAVVAFDRNNVFTYPGGTRNSGAEDASIVAAHMASPNIIGVNAGAGFFALLASSLLPASAAAVPAAAFLGALGAAMHKVYDFKDRFGYQMCVGCGRCDDICPEYISFSACVNKLGDAIKEVEANEE